MLFGEPACHIGRYCIEQLMILYQQADAGAAVALVAKLSPQRHRFFAAQMGSVVEAEGLLQDVWLKIHRARHTYRPGEPLLPWVYVIARRVRVENRERNRESAVEVLPAKKADETDTLPPSKSLSLRCRRISAKS